MMRLACPDALANSFLADTCRALDTIFDLDAERIADPAVWQSGAVLLVALAAARLRVWRWWSPRAGLETGTAYWPKSEAEDAAADLARIGAFLSDAASRLGDADGKAPDGGGLLLFAERLKASPAVGTPALADCLRAICEELGRLEPGGVDTADGDTVDREDMGQVAFRAAALAHCCHGMARRLHGEVWSDAPLLEEAFLGALLERFAVARPALRYLEPLTADETVLPAAGE